jgi:hypothetical protein
MLKATKKINGNDFQFEFDKNDLEAELIQALSVLKFDKCSCGSTQIFWNGYTTKEGYKYVLRRCKCGLQSKLAQNQTTKEYFWRDWEPPKTEAPQSQTAQPTPQQTQPPEPAIPPAQPEPEPQSNPPEFLQ